jgi:CMP-2-keto-3-deoxyoctulosonic acid synthetase
MNDRRRYQRYAVNDNRDTINQAIIKVDGELVQLVDFSVGGLCVLSKKTFSSGTKRISVEFKDRGKIELYGRIVRVKEEENTWRIGIDLTEIYKLNTLRKV